MQQALEDIIKIQPKGLITIPKKFREEIGLDENSLARVKKEGRRLIIEPVTVISYPLREYSKEEIEQFIKDDRLSPKLLKKLSKLFNNSE